MIGYIVTAGLAQSKGSRVYI